MGLILDAEKLAARRFKNQQTEVAAVYVGDVKRNMDGVLNNANLRTLSAPRLVNGKPTGETDEMKAFVSMETEVYKNSAAERKLMDDVQKIVDRARTQYQNAEQFRNAVAGTQYPSDLLDLIYATQLDITRRVMQEADYTDFVTQVITNPAFTKSVNLMELQRYTGVFKENGLNGESVPLIQQKTGAKDAVTMQGYALGWTQTLENMIYNTLNSTDKVNDAFVRAFVAKRNQLGIGLILETSPGTARTYPAEMHIEPDLEGETPDDRLYATFNKGIRALMAQYDYQTKKRIKAPRMVLMLGSAVAAYDAERVINGQLDNSKGQTANRTKLSKITDIIVYEGETYDYNDERITIPGVPDGKAYLFVPGSADAPWWTLVKAGLSQIVSSGDALTLSQEQRAQWFAQTSYSDEFFGTASSNTTITGETDHTYGYIVEIELPTEET
jgi:hypothetical protein